MDKRAIIIVSVTVIAVVAVVIIRKRKAKPVPPPPPHTGAAGVMTQMARLASLGYLPSMTGRLINQDGYDGPGLSAVGTQKTVDPNNDHNDLSWEEFQRFGGDPRMMQASRSGSVFSLDPRNQFVGALRM